VLVQSEVSDESLEAAILVFELAQAADFGDAQFRLKLLGTKQISVPASNASALISSVPPTCPYC
jgi:hypothetical protein